MSKFQFIKLALLIVCHSGWSKELVTNAFEVHNAPEWLKRTRVEKITDRIQTKLEWTVRRSSVFYHPTQGSYSKAQNLGPRAIAVTRHQSGKSQIHLGPKVNDENFDEIFAHEVVHVIIEQKYKGAIPKWFEEGLANHLSKAPPVDYKWLVKFDFPKDVRELAHPFDGADENIRYSYKASQALAEMLAKKCDLENLLRLSVERKMEDYIRTYCEIPDLNLAFQKWVKGKAG